MTAVRWSTIADGGGLAEVHRASWRYAYAGIIPGLTLERMIARRGPAWWSGCTTAGSTRWCSSPAARSPAMPRSAGAGHRRCRPAARSTSSTSGHYRAAASAAGCSARPRPNPAARAGGPAVWALAENEVACRFYRAMGGAETARAQDRFCGRPLDKIGFGWTCRRGPPAGPGRFAGAGCGACIR